MYFAIQLFGFFSLTMVRIKHVLVESLRLLNCECGGPVANDVAQRITGGVDAPAGRYPWMVFIDINKSTFCGGVLINDLYVLTSGHCVDVKIKLNFRVIVNMHDRISKYGEKFRPVKVIRNPDYKVLSSRSIINDIALVKLDKRVPVFGDIHPICLPNPDSDYSKHSAKILGWGRNEAGITANTLMEAPITVMSDTYCMKSMIGAHYMESMICGYSNQSDACQGDSGGPIFYEGKYEKMELIGLTSWGLKCGTEFPGIYTKVSHFMNWIELNTQDAGYCKAK